MKMEDIKMDLDFEEIQKNWKKYFYQAHNKWERKRKERLSLEKPFLHFTGHIDMIELHLPFAKYKYAFEMMERTKEYPGKKILVLAGDNINLDMFSYFYKASAETESPFKELENLIRFLKTAEKIYNS